MSGPSVEEKLHRSASTAGRAQRTLRTLASVPFVKVGPGSEKAPAWFVIPVMEGWTRWRWISGSGEFAVYELEGPVTP